MDYIWLGADFPCNLRFSGFENKRDKSADADFWRSNQFGACYNRNNYGDNYACFINLRTASGRLYATVCARDKRKNRNGRRTGFVHLRSGFGRLMQRDLPVLRTAFDGVLQYGPDGFQETQAFRVTSLCPVSVLRDCDWSSDGTDGGEKRLKSEIKRVSGSFTVEAAFIVPMLFAIILGLLQLGLTLHDRVAAEGLLNDALFQIREQLDGKTDGIINFAALSKARIFFKDEKTVLNEGLRNLETNASKTLLISEFREPDIKKSTTELKVTVDLKTRSIMPGWAFFDTKVGTAHYEISMPLFGKEEKTRLVSVVFEELVRYGLVK